MTDSRHVTAVSGATAKQEITPGRAAEMKHISEPGLDLKEEEPSIVRFGGKTWRRSCERHPPMLHKDQNPPESRGDVLEDDRMSA